MKNQPVSTQALGRDVLFEIGCEELPATNLADIFESHPSQKGVATARQGQEESLGETILEARLKKIFEEKRLSYQSCAVWATPRRLVFLVKTVPPAQAPKENLIKGPSKQDAYLPDDTPHERLLGFLRSKKASIKEVQIQQNQGKEYVYIKQTELAKKTQDVLPEIFDSFVRTLAFPKNMRWDASGVYFPRPIRNFLCIYGQKSLTFRIGDTPVKNETLIFSKGSRKRYRVKDIESYFKLMKKEGVLLDPSIRKEAIHRELLGLAKSLDGHLYEDPFLLNEVNFLAEKPAALKAPFNKEFLKLPLEVLTVSMARKQRIFGLLNAQGQVIPYFLGVTDGVFAKKDKERISKNYEHILHAKLQDSLFFYQEDIKIPLEKRRDELKNLIFLKGAGSMLEKSGRLEKLSTKISQDLSLGPRDKKNLQRASFLCKADLLTLMVGEFPELQGIIGKYYALENREDMSVSVAIGEQYLPRTTQDKLPQTPIGGILSLLDKCDLITACFGLGLEPSSSVDPYGLRRSASAALKIILDQKISFSLTGLLEDCQKELEAYILKDKAQGLSSKLNAFFKDRFKALMVDRGFRAELVDAILATNFNDVQKAFTRLEILSQCFNEVFFPKAWKVVERTMNILKSVKEPLTERVDTELLVEELEKKVYQNYEGSHEAIRQATRAGDYRLATSLYAEAFFDILDQFFEKVYVNADDQAIRKNRLSLLSVINRLYTDEIADLSKVNLFSAQS